MSFAKRELPQLVDSISEFASQSNQIDAEYAKLEALDSPGSPLWELLQLPQRMDKCIRAGRYEEAYSLTSYALHLRQQGGRLAANPLVKEVVETLMDSRHRLLDELFAKFSQPLELAKSIQIVNSIRKIPHLSQVG